MKKKVKYKVGGSTSPIDMQSIGQTISMASGLASFIPGIGPAVGLGGSVLGSLLSNMTQPQKPKIPNYNNTAPFGFFTGGDLNALSSNAVEVTADNPQQVDSVENDKIALDHGEVVTEGKVFSNTLVDPLTNRSFAKLEKGIQKSKGKYEKYKASVGDTETNDDTYYDRLSKATFERQESLAKLMGLRNPDGTPVQDKPNGYRFGGKIKYNTGGPFSGTPVNYFTGTPPSMIDPLSTYGNYGPYAANTVNQSSTQYMLQGNPALQKWHTQDPMMTQGTPDATYQQLPRGGYTPPAPVPVPNFTSGKGVTSVLTPQQIEEIGRANYAEQLRKKPMDITAVPFTPLLQSWDPEYAKQKLLNFKAPESFPVSSTNTQFVTDQSLIPSLPGVNIPSSSYGFNTPGSSSVSVQELETQSEMARTKRLPLNLSTVPVGNIRSSYDPEVIAEEMARMKNTPLNLPTVPVGTVYPTSDPRYDASTDVSPNPLFKGDRPGTTLPKDFKFDPTGIIGSDMFMPTNIPSFTPSAGAVNVGEPMIPNAISNPNLAPKDLSNLVSEWDAAKAGVNEALNNANRLQAQDEKAKAAKSIMGNSGKLPWGTAGTAIGVLSNLAGILMNKQQPVNYENVGRPEYLQQNLALRRLNEGEQTAINNVMGQSAAARGQVNARSQQVRNANLANIASSAAQAVGNVRSQFANQESQTRQAIGARRTGIEAMNLQKNMQVDDINTRERDAQLSQNMKMADNIREALIEKQWAENKLNYNDILAKMMQTDNFKWDENTRQILFKIQEQEARKQGGK